MNANLTTTENPVISDMSFADYNKRQLYEVSADRNKERAFNVKPAGNFLYTGATWVPQQYEGFAIVSMLNDNNENEALAARLTEIQTELQYNLSPAYAFYQLPSESFHQTVANTLSADRFKKNIIDAGLEAVYPSIVGGAFENIPEHDNQGPLMMKMAGLSVFGTAIGLLGVLENEDDYSRITRFRSGFYGDPKLTHPLNKNQKEHLASVVTEINEALSREENYFNIAKTGLRRYQHLAEFINQDNYPTYLL